VSSGYELRLSGAVRRALEQELPLDVALEVWAFCTGPLRDDPRRVGKAPGRELPGYFSGRRGAYRVVCRVDEDCHAVHVVCIEHWADVY